MKEADHPPQSYGMEWPSLNGCHRAVPQSGEEMATGKKHFTVFQVAGKAVFLPQFVCEYSCFINV